MLTMYEKTLFGWFAWLISKYKNKFFLVLSRFALQILDLSLEASTTGVLQKKLFLEILQYSLILQINLLLNRWLLLLIIKIKLH